MNSSARYVFFLLSTIVLIAAGCAPEFEESSCSSDSDCFADQTCQSGVCVAAQEAPVIDVFRAEPEVVAPGETVTLEWEVTNGTGGVIEGGDFSEDLNTFELDSGSVDVEVSEDTTFTLTVEGGGETVTAETSVSVDAPEATIVSFVADPNPANADETVTLSWETENAVVGTISGPDETHTIPDDDLAAGSYETAITEETEFTLTVENVLAEQKTSSVTVGLDGDPPMIQVAQADPTTIVEGENSVISWKTSGADSVTLTDDGGTMVDLGGASADDGTVTVSPTQTTTYTLTATNQFGDETRDITIDVEETIAITSFTATPSTIGQGANTELAWQISGSPTTVELVDPDGANIDISTTSPTDGTVKVSPDEDSTYTLVAQSANQQDTAQTTVTVLPPAPTITAFEANPTTVVANGLSTLSWTVDGATTLTVEDDQGNPIDVSSKSVQSDTIDVTVASTTTYTLTATNAGGSDTADVTVDVGPQVAITSFDASPTSIGVGDSTTLSWQTTDATSLTLTDDHGNSYDLSGANIGADTFTVSPSQTTTFTLSAAGLGGPVTETATVTVAQPVVIDSFGANPATIDAGQSTTLSWTTSNATSITISYVDSGGQTQTVDTTGKSLASDSVSVSPSQTTTYTLSADGFQGPVTSNVVIQLNPPATITNFVADKSTVTSSDTVTLSWTTTDADSISLTDDQGGTYDLSGKNISGDTFTVTPTSDITYTLSATGGGVTDTADVVIDVVSVQPLRITEIFMNATGADDGLEWVEIYNPGSDFATLDVYSIGSGGTDYTYSTLGLTGTLPPGGCAVIGGPNSGSANENPTYFQAEDFDPDLQNGGTTADAVGIFVARPGEITSASVPLDAVAYGTQNDNSLLDSSGSPFGPGELSPNVAEGISLERTDTSNVFVGQSSPTPGRCFTATGVTPSSGPNDASGTITIEGYGLDADLDSFEIGTSGPLSCSNVSGGVECTLPATTDTGAQDLVVTRVNEYVDDGSGNPVISAIPSAEQQSTTVIAAYFFRDRLIDGTDVADADFWCGVRESTTTTATAGSPITVEAEIFVAGSTDTSGALPAGYRVQATHYTPGLFPYELFDHTWTDAGQTGVSGNNVVYATDLTSSTATTAEAAFRVSPDGGASYFYCDVVSSNGSDDGFQQNGGLSIAWN